MAEWQSGTTSAPQDFFFRLVGCLFVCVRSSGSHDTLSEPAVPYQAFIWKKKKIKTKQNPCFCLVYDLSLVYDCHQKQRRPESSPSQVNLSCWFHSKDNYLSHGMWPSVSQTLGVPLLTANAPGWEQVMSSTGCRQPGPCTAMTHVRTWKLSLQATKQGRCPTCSLL